MLRIKSLIQRIVLLVVLVFIGISFSSIYLPTSHADELSLDLDGDYIKNQFNLINDYQVGTSTLDEFEHDGWNYLDLSKGRIGIVAQKYENNSFIIVLGVDGNEIWVSKNFGNSAPLMMNKNFLSQRRNKDFVLESDTATPLYKLIFENNILLEKIEMPLKENISNQLNKNG